MPPPTRAIRQPGRRGLVAFSGRNPSFIHSNLIITESSVTDALAITRSLTIPISTARRKKRCNDVLAASVGCNGNCRRPTTRRDLDRTLSSLADPASFAAGQLNSPLRIEHLGAGQLLPVLTRMATSQRRQHGKPWVDVCAHGGMVVAGVTAPCPPTPAAIPIAPQQAHARTPVG